VKEVAEAKEAATSQTYEQEMSRGLFRTDEIPTNRH
jgi:hypothetical protein